MKQYRVVTDSDLDDLAVAVDALLVEGWQLHGGIAVAAYESRWTNGRKGYEESEQIVIYAQAMTREVPA